MVAKKNSNSKKSEVVVPPAPVAEPEVAPVDAKVKPAKSTKAKATKASPQVECVENTVVVAETVVVEANESSDLADAFTEFMAKFQSLMTTASLLKQEFRILEKRAMREIKAAQKQMQKRKKRSTTRQPSGFVKPTLISQELATFLGKPEGTEMARTEVTREINGYIRLHNLQDKSNGRKINPDKSLATLLKINNGEELTYFNLQRYMSPHFAKAGAKTVDPSQGAQPVQPVQVA